MAIHLSSTTTSTGIACNMKAKAISLTAHHEQVTCKVCRSLPAFRDEMARQIMLAPWTEAKAEVPVEVPVVDYSQLVIRYEQVPCGRCGGSGRYSYCQMYGDTCFGCRGKGKVLSRAGSKAYKAIEDFIRSNFRVPVESIEAGMRVRDGDRTFTVTVGAHSHIKAERQQAGDGEWKYSVYIEGKSRYRGFDKCSYGYAAGDGVIIAPTGSNWARVIEFARTIKKGLTIATKESK